MASKNSSQEKKGGDGAAVNQSGHVKGSALTKALLERAEELEMDRYQLADSIGITYSYLTLILNGGRDISKITDEKLRSMGRFLGIPFAQVLMLAEVLRPEDFIVGDEETIDASIRQVYASMSRHPEWRGLAPTDADWANTPRQVKIVLGMMFQRLTNEEMLEVASMIEVEDEEDQEQA
ncbi:helix-turn-helix transcriptional regulator [Thioalkalivibrio sp. ALgr3]|uniref:helix-turn-helix domain-containing protein n=1 Tax=Thioalkalivibrio sp. ALgr3 TaxID=1239292 RepID=UPI00056F3E23|nr:helix-turn-helix transcriptional regulator [Thioalkalivibrio sp. ALgr3]